MRECECVWQRVQEWERSSACARVFDTIEMRKKHRFCAKVIFCVKTDVFAQNCLVCAQQNVFAYIQDFERKHIIVAQN